MGSCLDTDIDPNIVPELKSRKIKETQGVKLRLIQAPMRLNFSLWRPNPES